jgi:xylulose-5-phosphate/fructose-6-phosphate phosphoketolase
MPQDEVLLIMSVPLEEITNERPLSRQQLDQMHAYWRACNYRASGMIYSLARPIEKPPWLRHGTALS